MKQTFIPAARGDQSGGRMNVRMTAIMPALHSCAQSQKVIPAFGNRSEIGIIAEPIMPNALSMPCICSTLTKASSVVIFIVAILNLQIYNLVLHSAGNRTGIG